MRRFWCSSSEVVFYAPDREWLVKQLSERLLSKLEFKHFLTVSDKLILLTMKPLVNLIVVWKGDCVFQVVMCCTLSGLA